MSANSQKRTCYILYLIFEFETEADANWQATKSHYIAGPASSGFAGLRNVSRAKRRPLVTGTTSCNSEHEKTMPAPVGGRCRIPENANLHPRNPQR